MKDLDSVALDRWITGNYGEDQYPDERPDEVEATSETACEACGLECETDEDHKDGCPLAPNDEPGWVAYCTEMQERFERLGPDLASAPDEMECYGCAGFNGVDFVMRKVAAIGPVCNPADPTQSYKLECGHTTI